ncbi:MAG: OmpA family protein [Saprospiraceae bacterium]|nr:OmpA family protein [Saprospiraceae bacterium]
MTRKLIYTFIFCALSFYVLDAQSDAFTKPVITDEMTVDPEQNKNWRMGKAEYSAKPKNAWELGIHLGHYMIDGDVDRLFPAGYGLGLHLRKAIHYAFSIRGDFMYGQARGLDPQIWSHSSRGGGLVEDVFAPYANQDGWFPAYKTNYGYVALQGVLNIGNLLFHKERNKWNWYTALGIGLSSHSAHLNLLDANGNPYSGLAALQGNFDTRAGRKEIRDNVKSRYDNTYETPGWKKAGIFRLGDETNVHAVFTASVGVSRKLSKRINIGLEHQVMLSDNDALDGIRFRTALDQTNNNDIGHYTNLRLGINLGNFSKVTEPLYWLNPISAQMNDIAELKQRPALDLTDSDGDGVIDMLDQEKDTPAGAPVDTRGIALDSDGDGIPDYRDKEPYSPPGYPVNKDGVADVKCCITEADVNRMIDAKMKGRSDCGKWFLPMIHFDLDRYNVKPEFFGHLHHVANVMKMCPDVCVAVIGHTDVRHSNAYNNTLSYNRAEAAINYLTSRYGIDRSRFKLMYGGEETPLAPGSRSNTEHYMNRRVEFRVCMPEDKEMSRPEGSAGKGMGTGVKSTGSSKGTGDKNSGY